MLLTISCNIFTAINEIETTYFLIKIVIWSTQFLNLQLYLIGKNSNRNFFEIPLTINQVDNMTKFTE